MKGHSNANLNLIILNSKPNVKWGPTPKTVVAVIVGYFLGKLSYQNKCAEKIMALPNSKLGEMLKMKRKGGLYER